MCDMLREIDALDLDNDQREIKAIVIATQLRTLLFDSKNTKSVLSQLGIKDKLFFMPICGDGQVDFASNMIPSYLLVDCQLSNNKLCVSSHKNDNYSHKLNVFFDNWWHEIVIDTKGPNPVRLNREQVVRTLCDKEGGAHLDPEFTDEYYEVNYNFGYKLVKDNGEIIELSNNVFAETTISIAYELLDAISVYFYNVQNKKLVKENTPYTIIKITYSDKKSKQDRRFFLNTKDDILMASRLAFDYYHKASYSICKLCGFKYIRDDGSFFSFLTVDDKTEKEIVVLRNDDTNTYEVLMEVSNGQYSIIDHDDNSVLGEAKSLPQIIDELSKGEPSCFDKFLSLQVL